MIIHPEAAAEARAARRWYLARSPVAATRFMGAYDRAVEAIIQGPERWPVHLHGTRRVRMRRFPYALVYRIVTGEVQVLAVAHDRRKPGYWRTRR